MAHAALPYQFEIGFVGLDAVGRKLVSAVTNQGFRVVVYDRDAKNVKRLQDETPGSSVRVAAGLTEFMELLQQFRTVVVNGLHESDDSFNELLGRLEAEDVLIDAGDGYFKDSARRANTLAKRNIHYIGMGIIGGREGSVGGPILMTGGRSEIYQSVLPLIEAMAPKGNAEQRLSYLGHAAAGHFVKMAHDGIECGLAQLVLETFGLLKSVLDLDEQELRDLTGSWQMSELKMRPQDKAARQTSQVARELNLATPTIDAAAGMRTLSEFELENDFATTPFRQPLGRFGEDLRSVLSELHCALRASILITYAEGMAVLAAGSQRYGFDFDLAEIVRLWQGCSGSRGALLGEIAEVLRVTPHLPNLLDDDDLSETVMAQQECLRHAVWRAGMLQMSVPCLTASLDYLDSYRGAWLPGNLIQVPAMPPRLGVLGRH